MRHFAILCFAAVAIAADDPAGWSAAKWGMTLDQVRAAVPDSHPITGPVFEKKIPAAPLGIDEIEIAGCTWRAYFLFNPNLVSVRLEPKAPACVSVHEFSAVETLLLEKYGRPFSRNSASATDPGKVQTAVWSFPKTTIELRYANLAPRIRLETLSINYQLKSKDADKL